MGRPEDRKTKCGRESWPASICFESYIRASYYSDKGSADIVSKVLQKDDEVGVLRFLYKGDERQYPLGNKPPLCCYTTN